MQARSPSVANRDRWLCTAMENPTKLQLEMRKEWIQQSMLVKVMKNLKDIESRVQVSSEHSVDSVKQGCLQLSSFET